jgi:hypothetical protein
VDLVSSQTALRSCSCGCCLVWDSVLPCMQTEAKVLQHAERARVRVRGIVQLRDYFCLDDTTEEGRRLLALIGSQATEVSCLVIRRYKMNLEEFLKEETAKGEVSHTSTMYHSNGFRALKCE